MRRFSVVLLAGLLISPLALAQEKPEAPKPKTDRKVFFAGVSLLAASKTADAITTRQNLDLPDGRGAKLNPIFGRHPSPVKQSLINLGIFGVQAGAFYLTEHNRHAWIRWTGRALIGHEILEHSLLAACAAQINTQSPMTQSCKPLIPILSNGPDDCLRSCQALTPKVTRYTN